MPLSRIKSRMEVSQLRLDSSAASTDVNERVLLDASATATDAGYALILEDSTANSSDAILSQSSIESSLKSAESPIFRAHLLAAQTISSATDTKVTLNVVTLDIGNYFDLSNNRYTPQVAGNYLFTCQLRESSGETSTALYSAIYKNGEVAGDNIFMHSSGILSSASGSMRYSHIPSTTILPMNGNTDYVELYAYIITSSGSPIVDIVGQNTFLTGILISRF